MAEAFAVALAGGGLLAGTFIAAVEAWLRYQNRNRKRSDG